jgi:molybdopterin-guanine dinucleotide biosynthesis protein A
MGSDKALMEIEGAPAAGRVRRVLEAVARPVVEVGPGVTGAPAVREEPAGSGPLVGLAAGGRALRELGHLGPALVLACDLPLINSATLLMLARWPGSSTVVPVIGGRPQGLCARWSARDLAAADRLAQEGERSVRALLERSDVTLLSPELWPPGVDASNLADADFPEDLDRLGVSWRAVGGGTGAGPTSDA